MDNNKQIVENYDAIVVGAGHAGCEACLALARMGFNTVVFTISVDNIALMPCNPNIGGSSKGHIVREVDALGGEMGKNIDKAFIQSKMLNKSKGPAVHSLRAQADKQVYTREMRKTLENCPNLTIKQQEVTKLLIDDINGEKQIQGVQTISNALYYAKVVVLATGVYLNSKCLYGDVEESTGPNGLKNSLNLTSSLVDNSIVIKRFKTGTPARIDKRSIDFSVLEVQKGDEPIVPFSFQTNPDCIQIKQEDCYLAYTNVETHNIIRENIDRSPLYTGVIKGVGPRYCPSIEDKVMKFPDKDRHQIFVEPEGLYTNEMYLSGLSSSLPEDVQYKLIRSMKGFENAKIVRNAYAIEYDLIDSTQLKASLEFKEISGLFSAGQINGSSGYEEAAGQGLIAGINAGLYLKDKEPLILDRSEAYIGVLIDDLVTKESTEPYRMMTSRAEYRLLLRQDNADLRLRKYGHNVGLVSDDIYNKTINKQEAIDKEIKRLKESYIGVNDRVNNFLQKHNSEKLISGCSLFELCTRPELGYSLIKEIDDNRPILDNDYYEQISIEVKYEGYINREKLQVEKFKKLENKKIPKDIDYNDLKNLRLEARQKLNKYRPENIGQASRISGVSPSDIAVLMVYLKIM